MLQLIAADSLEKVEESLANRRPFGDWQYIEDRVITHYERRIEMLAEHLPIARSLLNEFRSAELPLRLEIMADPVVRDSVNRALCHFRLGTHAPNMDQCAEVLGIAERHLIERIATPPLVSNMSAQISIRGLPRQAWLWSSAIRENTLHSRFLELIHANLGVLQLNVADQSIQRSISFAVTLLQQLLSWLAPSSLSHVRLIVIVDSPFLSATCNPIEGTVFLSKDLLATPWLTSEFLLHEAMHQKFVDLEHTHSMLRNGYSPDLSPGIDNPWNQSAKGYKTWTIDRALTVSHVYTCLAVFFATIARKAKSLSEEFGQPHVDPNSATRQALGRAHFLIEQIARYNTELGVGGRNFHAWLTQLLLILDPQRSALDESVYMSIQRIGAEPLSLGA